MIVDVVCGVLNIFFTVMFFMLIVIGIGGLFELVLLLLNLLGSIVFIERMFGGF